MYLLPLSLVGAGALLLIVLGSSGTSPARLTQHQARGQLQQYQSFLYAANLYFGRTAPPTVATAYDWNAIRSATSPSMANAGMPAHWKVVRRPDGDWVACTEIAELTIAGLPGLFPKPAQAMDTEAPALLALTVPAASANGAGGPAAGAQQATASYVVLAARGGSAASLASLCGAA